MEKIIVIRVLKSFCKRVWGYDSVEGSDGNIYEIRQRPDDHWKAGDDITKAKKKKE